MGWIQKFVDRMIFDSTTDPLDSEGKIRQTIPFSQGTFEAWIANGGQPDSKAIELEPYPECFGLKFPGTGGRAERGGPHPCEVFSTQHEVWIINPPGYGSSDGVASLQILVEMCDAAWRAFSKRAESRKKIVIGNSLGTMYALYIAANYDVDAVFLRNPVPLKEIILAKYSWWNLGLGSRLATRLIPSQMDSIANAGKCRAPVFCVSAQEDRMIPIEFQQKIFDAFQGPAKIFKAHGIDHHEPIRDDQFDEYLEAVDEFQQSLN